ncbi:MAG TPA: tRNA uridine(34) 5-carboxymethylaminomethyl modification radical SAM/GNAT enzyme Elp3 [Candidatus Pacearchaeota archaeon]|nr:tRNA uridine(34) 5-carboxymethylaminomethyl modification radical SAM/GNAT enzyme Elp3 [Candidatus Pacearchaeota archaeon]HOK94141.1 tRNA uridine(34) 5-carboxymethylaminomethyl modification radical SAM/GNAT enzyme Elp3 [Candidatus Pacearchaeota archaeon]HPO75497.1 tRNA uridine(34) 5-carboxymethylaminomethyl modification radical SAM/GNAT enzyme Elp3 [Candidatus Pacearchaeota archaeon]
MSITPEEILIQELIKSKVKTPDELARLKRKISKEYKVSSISNIELLQAYHNLVKKGKIEKNEVVEKLLVKRKIRSLSGIVAVSVLTKPYPCPGHCIYCPQVKGFPKSYLPGEPAAERAKRLNFDPYLQVQKRLEMLENEGHNTDKIELRIIGGSFSSYPRDYKEWFLEECFRAANEFNKNPKSQNNTTRLLRSARNDLKKAQKKNETAKHRIVGASIETRPDLIDTSEIQQLRKLGITLVELGVQTIFDDILKICQRGHGVQETIKATKLLKDAGFKVLYQMMPNLPGATPERDLAAFKEIFENPDFKPDWLKIYPCLVLKEAPLYKLWKEGKYKSYSDEELIELLCEIKKMVPYWVRIARLFRDIPSPEIQGGSKISNLREVVLERLKEEGQRCKCIRCREVKENYDPKEKIYLKREDYEASQGKEIFLSFENKERTKLFAFLRLRIPSEVFSKEKHFIPCLKDSAVIREIHTYGLLVPISKKLLAPQHQGLGKKLVREAEKIVYTEFNRSAEKEFGLKKIAVISGVGVRDYWRKLGYRCQNTYMVKKLNLR